MINAHFDYCPRGAVRFVIAAGYLIAELPFRFQEAKYFHNDRY